MHVIGTAGHVDHGKSTLVRRLTGIDPDRLQEEKDRGLTIDLGFAWMQLPSGNEIGIVDVPGHERFIKNMLAGAGAIGICLFVVDALEGWKPQSAEHLGILDVLDVRHGVVALTKADLADAEGLEMARLDIEEHLRGTSLEDARIVACSAVTGQGIEELVEELDRAVAAAPAEQDVGRPRLWVDRSFTISGAGTVVTGTLTDGALEQGQEVTVLSGEASRGSRIRKIQSHKKEVDVVGPGNRVALNLVGLERRNVERGDVVTRPGTWGASKVCDVHLRVLPVGLLGREHELTRKGAHLLYVGTAETPVKVRLWDIEELRAGESGVGRLYLRDALPLRRGDRFVVRDAGRVLTLGGGVVLDPMPPATGGKERGPLLSRILHTAPAETLAALLEVEKEMSVDDASARTGTANCPGCPTWGGTVFTSERAEELRGALHELLGNHHRELPLEPGPDRESARAELGLAVEVFDGLVRSDNEITEEGPTIRLASHEVSLSSEEKDKRDAVVDRLDKAGFTPPLSRDLDLNPSLEQALVRSGDIVRIGDFYLSRNRAAEARRVVITGIESSGPLTVAQIRDLLGTTRKYAVPLCEWLDATGATIRRGDVRAAGPRP